MAGRAAGIFIAQNTAARYFPAMKAILAEASRVPLAKQIEDIVLSTPLVDVHTHLYDPAFKAIRRSKTSCFGASTTCKPVGLHRCRTEAGTGPQLRQVRHCTSGRLIFHLAGGSGRGPRRG